MANGDGGVSWQGICLVAQALSIETFPAGDCQNGLLRGTANTCMGWQFAGDRLTKPPISFEPLLIMRTISAKGPEMTPKKPEWSFFRCEICQLVDLGYDTDPPPNCVRCHANNGGHGSMKFVKTAADARAALKREHAERTYVPDMHKLTVAQLIALLQRCDPAAKVVWDYDEMAKNPTGIERSGDGVELLTHARVVLAELRDYGRDVIWPK